MEVWIECAATDRLRWLWRETLNNRLDVERALIGKQAKSRTVLQPRLGQLKLSRLSRGRSIAGAEASARIFFELLLGNNTSRLLTTKSPL